MAPLLRARWLLPALTTWFLLCMGQSGQAQSCHAPSLREAPGDVWRVALASQFASYENPQYEGEYQGVQATLAYSNTWLFVDASVPYYRVVRNGLSGHGVGDVATDLRLSLLRLPELGLFAGPELAVTFPSGDVTRDLGMGHTMLMPGAFVTYADARLTVIAQLAYGRAVGMAAGGHVHSGTGPIVSPMSRSEIEHALSLGFLLVKGLRMTARVFGAVPVAYPEGSAREVVSGGVQLVLGAFDVSIEQQVPVVGTPFDSKTQLMLGAQW